MIYIVVRFLVLKFSIFSTPTAYETNGGPGDVLHANRSEKATMGQDMHPLPQPTRIAEGKFPDLLTFF